MCLRVNACPYAAAVSAVVEGYVNLVACLNNVVEDNPELALPRVGLTALRGNLHTAAAVTAYAVGNLIDGGSGILLRGEVLGIVALHVAIVNQALHEGDRPGGLRVRNLDVTNAEAALEHTGLEDDVARRAIDAGELAAYFFPVTLVDDERGSSRVLTPRPAHLHGNASTHVRLDFAGQFVGIALGGVSGNACSCKVLIPAAGELADESFLGAELWRVTHDIIGER